MTKEQPHILEPEKNCWRIEEAYHAAMVVDAQDYYRALYEGICKAKRSLFLFGWDVDGRIPLIRGEEARGDCPVTLHDLITKKARENPDFEIYINQWDHPFVFAGDREFLAAARWRVEECPNIHFRFDRIIPMQASQHQKIVVIDDEIAFSGGLDVGVVRWDGRMHCPDNHHRYDFEEDKEDGAHPYTPNHDVQMVVSGPAAQALAELARRRWFLATDYEAVPIHPYNVDGIPDVWPEKNPPQFENVSVAIALTFPPIGETPAIRQIETLYYDMIANAQNFIYIENQYLANDNIARALNRRLKENPKLRVLIYSSRDPQGLAEEVSMWTKRVKFKKILEKGAVKNRVCMTYSISKGKTRHCAVHVHAKVMIVDDRYLQVGSANINDRSMDLDSECDMVVIGQTEKDRTRIADLRNDLIREHSGMEKEDIQSLIDNGNPISDFLIDVSYSTQHFRRVHDSISLKARVIQVLTFTGAKHRPISNLIAKYMSEHDDKAGFPHKRASKNLLFIMCLLMALLFWRYTPAAEWLNMDNVQTYIQHVQTSEWSVPIIIASYVLGSLFFVPITLLIAATAAVFGPVMGFGLALMGSIASAAVTFGIGLMAGDHLFKNYSNTAFMRINDRLKGTGVMGLAALRMVPIAPFTLVNMILGVSGIKFVSYLAGTVLGMLPGMAAMVILGDSLATIWRDPDPQNLLYIAVAILLWLSVLVGIHVLLKSERERRGKEYV